MLEGELERSRCPSTGGCVFSCLGGLSMVGCLLSFATKPSSLSRIPQRHPSAFSPAMEVILIIGAGLAATTRAQFVAGTDGNDGSPSLLCNQSFADANATGIFSFDPGVVQGAQEDQPDNDSNYALNAQWGITVYNNIGQPNSTLEIAGWYNTNGANYSDNADLWYDVCFVTLNGFSLSEPAIT